MLVNLWREKQYPPKVIAMNQAVLELLSEGRGLESIKVSEITQRAGIGKGTAYEYFSSKEEIIATALEYDLDRRIADLMKIEEDAVGFQDILERLMVWLADNFKSNAGFTILLRAGMDSCEVSTELKEALRQKCPGTEIIKKMLDQVLVIGETEQAIQQKPHFFGETAILSQVVAYAMYLAAPEANGEISESEARAFAVESIMKMLN